MLHYKNHKMYKGGVVFEIPEKSERKNILVVLIKSEESTIAENADFVAEFMNSLKRDAF